MSSYLRKETLKPAQLAAIQTAIDRQGFCDLGTDGKIVPFMPDYFEIQPPTKELHP